MQVSIYASTHVISTSVAVCKDLYVVLCVRIYLLLLMFLGLPVLFSQNRGQFSKYVKTGGISKTYAGHKTFFFNIISSLII